MTEKLLDSFFKVNKADEEARGEYMIESLAIQDSKREGRKEGIAEGRQEKAIEDAKSFYANGVSVELIAKSLQMTVEQVENIVKDTIQKEA